MTYKEEMKWLKEIVDGHGVELSKQSENINTLMRIAAAQEKRLRLFEQLNLGNPDDEGE